MPIDITGKFQPSDHAHGFDLYDWIDMDTNSAVGLTVGDVLTAISATGFAFQSASAVNSRWAYTAVTAAYSIATSDAYISCTGTITVTLPTAVGVSGKIYDVKNAGTGIVTMATTSSQTIDGGLTAVLRDQYESLTVISNGANWEII